MVERVEWNGELFALILRNTYEEEGVNFFTGRDNPFQLGILKHKRGTKIRPHIHKSLPKIINSVQEVLHVEYGKVKAEFYTQGGEKIESRILNPGDTVLLISGGHGFNILQNSKIMEVKQGPYYGTEGDKKQLNKEQGSGQ